MDYTIYWTDICEGGPAEVCLFGRVLLPDASADHDARSSKHASCCVRVYNVPRNVFFLYRPDASDADVVAEVSAILRECGVRAFKCRPVMRNSAFDEPHSGRYLKVVYSADQPQLSARLVGTTFSRVCGTTNLPLDLFIVKRKLKGPGWLSICGAVPHIVSPAKVAGPDYRQVKSWCALELDVDSYKRVTVISVNMPAPPMTVLCLAIHAKDTEVAAVSGVVYGNIDLDANTAVHHGCAQSQFTVVVRNKADDTAGPFILASDEQGLLNVLVSKVALIDPDIVAGHNMLDFELDFLLHRIGAQKVPRWSRIGRLRRDVFPKLGAASSRATFQERAALSGRILCDIKVSAREICPSAQSYDLCQLAQTVLGTEYTDTPADATLLALALHIKSKAMLIARLVLEMNALPLAKQIANVTGSLLSRTLAGGRSERNDRLLSHEFHARKFMLPERNRESKPPKTTFTGGLVLEPVSGLYTTCVAVLDFNSLYPSIIQEYDICFLSRHAAAATIDGTSARILPELMRHLVERRRAVKSAMASAQDSSALEIRQKALKLTANAMYGCLSFYESRFYEPSLAEKVAAMGRRVLEATVDLVQREFMLKVVYGDTDSVMIDTRMTDPAAALALAYKVAREINRVHTHLIIEPDGIFTRLLLHTKKKYAGIKYVGAAKPPVHEIKGMDIVRRDWCEFSHRVGMQVLDMVLEAADCLPAVGEYLRAAAHDARQGCLPLTEFVIRKTLNKQPSHYPDKHMQPHVTVALRMQASGKQVGQHDTIPYIICKDGTQMPAAQRAYHPSDLGPKVEPDVEYYIEHQIYPVVTRILEHVKGAESVPELLGICAVAGNHRQQAANIAAPAASHLQLTCSECGLRYEIAATEAKCLVCGTAASDAYMCNMLTLEVRRLASVYHASEIVCDAVSCSRTIGRGVHSRGIKCPEPGCSGNMRRVYTWELFQSQLAYLLCAVKQMPVAHAHMQALAVKHSHGVATMSFVKPAAVT